MKPAPRVWTIALWTSLGLGAVLAALLAVSLRWSLYRHGTSSYVAAVGGAAVVSWWAHHDDDHLAGSWGMRRVDSRPVWWPRGSSEGSDARLWVIPLWMPLGATLLATWLVSRQVARQERPRKNCALKTVHTPGQVPPA